MHSVWPRIATCAVPILLPTKGPAGVLPHQFACCSGQDQYTHGINFKAETSGQPSYVGNTNRRQRSLTPYEGPSPLAMLLDAKCEPYILGMALQSPILYAVGLQNNNAVELLTLSIARAVKVCHLYGSKCALVRHAFIERLLEELNYWKVSASDLNSLDIPLWKKRLQRLILDAILGFSDSTLRVSLLWISV